MAKNRVDLRFTDHGSMISVQAPTRTGCEWLARECGADDSPGFTGTFIMIQKGPDLESRLVAIQEHATRDNLSVGILPRRFW